MCVLAAGMSLFDQGTASECSAALSTLPRGFPDVSCRDSCWHLNTGGADVEGPERPLQKKVKECEKEGGIQWAQP